MDRPSLRVDEVDLESLIVARNDGHPDGDWWFDPASGECLYLGVDDELDVDALRLGDHVLVTTEPQPRADIDAFFRVADLLGVADEAVMDLYERYRGRGGARRFRERVGESEAGPAWRTFVLEREAVRAVRWLVDEGLVCDGPEWLAAHPSLDE